jgi:hypothetical protein
MCLRLLPAEIWSQGLAKKLHRFTARLVPDTILQTPAVIVHGRLRVLGGDNQRIHEEIILAGGMIKEGRFSRMNVGETEKVGKAASSDIVPSTVHETLTELWPKLEPPLLKALEARMEERTKNLQKFLDERAHREVANVTAVMQELERSIREVLNKKDDPQLTFGWGEDEKEQRERDINNLRRRLTEIPGELAQEARHLRDRYRDPHARLFPIAVTFLIPPRAIAQIQRGRR